MKTTQQMLANTLNVLRDKGLTVGFAESCTGGLLSSELTKIAGVSDIFVGSVVCYANSVKEAVLGVKSETLNNFGAVSGECAVEMANGVIQKLQTHVAVSITGVAGPTGGSEKKPVGTVFIAVAGTQLASKGTKTSSSTTSQNFHHVFSPELSREGIQQAASAAALEHLFEFVQKNY